MRKGASKENLCLKKGAGFREAIGVFKQFRDNNWTVPAGYRITWKNVLSAVKENGEDVPCVFKSGEFKGYFGSMTRLTNGLTSGKGECEINNQINPLTIPALVLASDKRGDKNIVKAFGANVGDLLVAYNPSTQLFTSAIIGDTGPPDNLGEGSVSLNMMLRGVTVPPKNKAETFKLSIEKTQVLVAIIPASRLFREAKPYTKENINKRVEEWLKEAGFATSQKFIELMKQFQPNLR